MAKSKAKKKTSIQVSDDDSNVKVVFGVVIDVNGTLVPISTDDIQNYQNNGFRFEQKEPVKLGSFQDIIDWLDSNFNVTIPITDLPDPIQDMVNAVASFVFTVEQLKIYVPGKNANDPDGTQYLLRISGAWDESKTLIPGISVLKLKGGVFGVTNMPNPDEQF